MDGDQAARGRSPRGRGAIGVGGLTGRGTITFHRGRAQAIWRRNSFVTGISSTFMFHEVALLTRRFGTGAKDLRERVLAESLLLE